MDVYSKRFFLLLRRRFHRRLTTTASASAFGSTGWPGPTLRVRARFTAALTSRSWEVPHDRPLQVRSLGARRSFLAPQTEQSFDDGYQRSATIKAPCPGFSGSAFLPILHCRHQRPSFSLDAEYVAPRDQSDKRRPIAPCRRNSALIDRRLQRFGGIHLPPIFFSL